MNKELSPVWRENGIAAVYKTAGELHYCGGNEVHPGIKLLWIRCERADRPGGSDVPADAAWLQRPEDVVTCKHCLEGLTL